MVVMNLCNSFGGIIHPIIKDKKDVEKRGKNLAKSPLQVKMDGDGGRWTQSRETYEGVASDGGLDE